MRCAAFTNRFNSEKLLEEADYFPNKAKESVLMAKMVAESFLRRLRIFRLLSGGFVFRLYIEFTAVA